MTKLTPQQLGTTETRVVSLARRMAEKLDASKYDANSAEHAAAERVSNLVHEAMESTIARAVRPILICFGLSELLGDEMDTLPIVGSKDGNNPDKYITGYNKKTNEPKWGSFYDWYVESLPIFKPHKDKANAIKEAKKKDGVVPKGFERIATMGADELSSEQKTIQAQKQAAKSEIVKAIQIYQMADTLSEFETIQVTFDEKVNKDGSRSFNDRTKNPIILQERYAKRNEAGEVVKDSEGDVVYTTTGKIVRLSVSEFIALNPHHAATMDGGFSFDNLMKARRDLAEQRQQAEQAAIQENMVRKPEAFFKFASDLLAYISPVNPNCEAHMNHLLQVMSKDETRLAEICGLKDQLDLLTEDVYDRYREYNKRMNREADGKQAAAA
jgi:hypothetical protein